MLHITDLQHLNGHVTDNPWHWLPCRRLRHYSTIPPSLHNQRLTCCPLSCATPALPGPYADHLRAPSPIRHIPTSVNAQCAKPGRCDHDPTTNHHDRNNNEGVPGPQYHLYDFPNLARLHGSVNWHLHYTCEVYQSFSVGYLQTGLRTCGFLKNPYPDPLQPLPLVAGTGLVR